MRSHRPLVAGSVLVAAALACLVVLLPREAPTSLQSAMPGPASSEDQPAIRSGAPRYEAEEAELASALTVACDPSGATSDDREWDQGDAEARAAYFEALQRSLSEHLSVSSSAEHLHLAALFEDDQTQRTALLDRAIATSPSDPFLVWSAVQMCSEIGTPSPCPLQDWEQLLVEVDGQNSEAWIRVAANRYAAGDDDSALEALRRASTAAETRVYWTETIEMIERGLAAGSDYDFAERAELAFGFAATRLPRYRDYFTMCEEQSFQSAEWAYACLAYGELAERQGKIEMGVLISRGIQRMALEAMGEAEKASELEQQSERRREEALDAANDYIPAVDRLIHSSPAVFAAYLAAIRSEGEIAARRNIEAEVERLIARQPELGCE